MSKIPPPPPGSTAAPALERTGVVRRPASAASTSTNLDARIAALAAASAAARVTPRAQTVTAAAASVAAAHLSASARTLAEAANAGARSAPLDTTHSHANAPVARPEDIAQSKVSRAIKAKEAVGAALDKLNAEFESAEVALRKLDLNVFAYVRLTSGGDDDGPFEYADLAWRPGSRGWRLVVEEGHNGSPEETTTDICRASKELRILAAKKLPELLDRMVQQAEEEAGEVRAGIDGIRSFTAALTGRLGAK